jgi:hypothetical protein
VTLNAPGVLGRAEIRAGVFVVEDQAGFEPAMSLRCRLKRPARSAATVTGPMIMLLEDASGYDPQADGLKIRSLSIRV